MYIWIAGASINTFHLIGVKKVIGEVVSGVTSASLTVDSGGVTKVGVNVQETQSMPFPSDVFLLMELGIN